MDEQKGGVCPLCLKGMDITDQELQPCICGYKICLWCWHVIIQTASEECSDARCPACRNPYDKEKVLKRTINKERLEVVNTNKKNKLQKTKQSPPDVGKDFNSIRVIRRNIVYIAGISKNLSDEKILRKKEYLGQYGKIVKIFFTQTDVSRQCYLQDNCIVYVHFSKEEEAFRCIQVVNGYNLDGRPLKASFGTTRYCYSWINNIPCKTPDCLYVHEVAPPDDTCLKEEVISFCTSKLQQCPGLTYSNAKYHSGSFLPPPLDTKNSLPPLGFISNNRSYASVAASHNQPKLSSKNDDDIWLSSRPELFSPANSWDHRLACDGEMPLAKQNMESFAQSSQFVGIFHSKMTYSSDYNTVIDSNQLPVLIPETILEDQLLLFSDGTSQLSTNPANALTLSSADSLNTLTNIRPWEHKSAERIPKELSTEWNDLGTVSRRYDSFLSSQVLHENASSMQQNGISSYDLGSEKFSYGFGDETQYAPIRSKPKDFPTFSSIATKMRHKPDKPSANLPTDPTLFQNEHKNLCHKYSRIGISDVNKLSYNDKIKYQKLLNLSYIEQCKDQILSDIATLDLDTVDNLGNSISVLEQPDSSKDLSTISNSLLPFTRDGSHSYFSKPDNKFGAVEQYHPRYNGAHAWTMNPLCSEIMVKKEDFVEDLPNKQCLEVSNASKVLKWNKLPYANEVVGSPLTRAISQHPNSNFVQRTTLSTPPGFPPKQTFIGSTLQNQSQHSIYAFSNAMTTSNNSHTDILYTDSTKLSSAKEIHPSFCSPFNAY